MASKTQQSGSNDRRITVDIVIVGGGPATLGLLTNACKSNRYVTLHLHFASQSIDSSLSIID